MLNDEMDGFSVPPAQPASTLLRQMADTSVTPPVAPVGPPNPKYSRVPTLLPVPRNPMLPEVVAPAACSQLGPTSKNSNTGPQRSE